MRNKLGLLFALLHGMAVLLIAIAVSPNSQVWFWMFFIVIDFPISLVTLWGWDLMTHLWGENITSGTLQAEIYRNFPIVWYGIIGTIWWYFLPVIFRKLFGLGKQ